MLVKATAFYMFLLLMGSHGEVILGSSVDAEGPDSDHGASTLYSRPGPPNLFAEDNKEVRNELIRAAISSFSLEAAVAHPLPLFVDATLTQQPAGGVLPDEDGKADLTTGGPRDNWFARIGAHAAALESEEEASEVKQQKPKQELYDEEAAPPFFKQVGEDSWSHADDASVSNSVRGSATKLGENKEVRYEFLVGILHYYTSTTVGTSTSNSISTNQTKSCRMGRPRKIDGRRTRDTASGFPLFTRLKSVLGHRRTAYP
jgi:hypothetical protein